MLWYVPGQGVVDDSQEGATIPAYGEMTLPSGELIEWGNKDVRKLPEYTNTWQFGRDPFQWDPQHTGAAQGPAGGSYNVGYIPGLIDAAEALQRGAAMPDYVREQVTNMLAAARATPMRDLSQLQAGYPGEGGDLSRYLTPASPDAGAVMLALREKLQSGQATPQERGLYDTFLAQMREQDYRANVPQASDAFSVLGDNLFSALAILGTGATAGLAAAPLAAGTAGLASTLGSLGTLAGTAGGWAGTIGGATGQDWLQKAGLGLGALGGIAGGLGGLANLWGTGVQSLSDAARLASSVGKIGGALGSASGSPALKQAAGYLGMAGQAGQLGAGVLPTSFTDWSGTNAPLAANVAPGVSNLLSAADQATQRGGGMETDWGSTDWLDWSGGGQGPLLSDVAPGIDWGSFTSGGPGSWAGQMMTDWADGGGGSGGGGGLLSTLGGLAGAAGKFLGSNASWLGPAASTLGSLGAGAIGSNASSDAARLQAAALNRGIDLSTSQWLEQLGRTAPWVQAGQQALGTLQGLAGQQLPGLPGATPAVSGAQYGLPSTTPGWNPQMYQGPAGVDPGAYRWTPQQGPSAANYRYQPGQTPDAAQYASGPPQLYQGAMPGTQVSTLTGQQVLDQDPGYQFRQDEARRALEASALARGSGMSGSTLAALQRQSQDLASQEYGTAYNRMMGRDIEQYGRNWNQYQQNWNQGVTGAELGLRTNAQNFAQAEAASRLREQVNQVASQQGWSQAQAEAVFREQQAQLASQQGWNQALQGQQNQFTQGLDTSKWNTLQQQQYAQEQYKNMLEQSKWRYGQDVSQNETDYTRQQALYKQQLAQHLLPWDQYSTLAQLGGQMTGQLGGQGVQATSGIANLLSQLGQAQGTGAAGQGLAWIRALGGATNQLPSLLAGLNA